MIPVSCAPAVKAYLLAAFTAAVDPDPNVVDGRVLVTYGPPGNDVPADLVMIGKVTRTSQPYRLVGSGSLNWMTETFDVTVEVSVINADLDPQETDARVWHLIGLLESAVRADPSLGGLVTMAYPAAANVDVDWVDEDEGESGLMGVGDLRIRIDAKNF